jgi:hypothetical protein
MRPVLRYYRMIWATRPFSAPRMAAMLSWRQKSLDNIIRSSHGRGEFAAMIYINKHRKVFYYRGNEKARFRISRRSLHIP